MGEETIFLSASTKGEGWRWQEQYNPPECLNSGKSGFFIGSPQAKVVIDVWSGCFFIEENGWKPIRLESYP